MEGQKNWTLHTGQIPYHSERETGATGGSKPTLLFLELALFSASWSISPFQNKSLQILRMEHFCQYCYFLTSLNCLLCKIGFSEVQLHAFKQMSATSGRIRLTHAIPTSAFLTPNHFFQRYLWNRCYVQVPVVAITKSKWCSSFLQLLVWM